MDKTKRDDQCIERRYSFTPRTWYYSVSEYEDQFALAELWTTHDERSRHDLDWIEVAPAVEKLSTESFFPDRNGFRICDWEVYNSQMRQLLGLE